MDFDMSALVGAAGGKFKAPSYEEVIAELKQKAIILGIGIAALRLAPYVITAVQVLSSKNSQ